MTPRLPFVFEYVLYAVSTSLCVLVLVMNVAFVKLMLDPAVKNDPVYGIIAPAYNNTIIAFIGILGVVGGYIAGKAEKKGEADAVDRS